jgi:hypothetical protein
MSTVPTFTWRDLTRQSAKVLAAVRKFGVVEITTRSGEVLTVVAKSQTKTRKKEADRAVKVTAQFENLWAQQRAIGYEPPKASEWDEERFNRIIAGEE